MVEDGRLSIFVRLRDLESFKVEVVGLLWRCSFCRQQQVFEGSKTVVRSS